MNKTNKGGYQILDLGNIDLTGSPTIEGLYELIEGTKKPIRLTRINLGGVEKHDVVSMPVVSGSDYVFENVYGYDVSIDSDGNVSLASTKWATKAEIEAGTLDNAKPIYCHPISISDGASIKISCLIFTNDSEPMTLNTFKTFLDSLYSDMGAVVRIPCSGLYTDSNETLCIASWAGVNASGRYYVTGNTIADGTSADRISDTFSDVFSGTFNDGVNKIN